VKTDAERSALASPEKTDEPAHRRNRVLRFLGELPGLVLMALVLAILIKSFLIQAFYIPSASMENTLMIGDRVIVTQVPYYFHDPRHGDIVVFAEPDPGKTQRRGLVSGVLHWLSQTLGVSKPDEPDYIKRVIGLPGETVWARGGQVYVDGLRQNEPYLDEATRDFDKVTVPEGMLFVMGDNRNDSLDSRFGLGVHVKKEPGVGFVPIDRVIGKAIFIVWPPSRLVGL
jgi:signal peptidase I